MDTYTEMLISQDTPKHEPLTQELSVVAAQLVEAACKARDGDREATSAHIEVSQLGRRVEYSHTWKPICAEGFPFETSRACFTSAQATSAARSNAPSVFRRATMCCAGESRSPRG
jgi:hypothetical protein